MAVGCRGRVEPVCQLELGARSDVALALEDDDLVRKEGVADDVKIGLCQALVCCNVYERSRAYLGRLPIVRVFSLVFTACNSLLRSHRYLTCKILYVNAGDGHPKVDLGAFGEGEGVDNSRGHFVFELTCRLSLMISSGELSGGVENETLAQKLTVLYTARG